MSPDRQSVAGVAYNIDGHVLIMHRLPGGSSGGLWEFPGGKVEQNESREEALVREWQEELGISIRVDRHLVQGTFENKDQMYHLHAYKVLLPDNEVIPRLLEHDEYRWIDPEKLDTVNLVESDRIVARELITGR